MTKQTAYQFFSYDERQIVITKEMLGAIGVKCDARYLSRLSEKEQEQIINNCFDADTERYCFYYETTDGKYVNVYDGTTTGLKGDGWVGDHEDSGKEFQKFYRLVRV